MSLRFDSFLPSFMQLFPSDKSQVYISQSVSRDAASFFKAFVLRATRIRSYPRALSFLAISYPMPELAPVIHAVRFFILILVSAHIFMISRVLCAWTQTKNIILCITML